MTITTYSGREFNQDTSGAKRAASQGPVFITDRGKPAHVLLTFEQYLRLAASPRNLIEMLAMPQAAEVEFEPEKAGQLSKPVDLS